MAIKTNENKLASPKFGNSYTFFYSNMFLDKKDSVHKLLEIGSGVKRKNNLSVWQGFFPKAKIYGIDQANPLRLKKLIKEIEGNIDVVIDDGSQNLKDIITSCQTLMPLLKKDVVYVIEGTNRQQAAAIIDNLKNYNCHVMRRSRMKSANDRLISVTNITNVSKRIKMAKVSIIVPSCNEIREVSPSVTVLQRTVQDIYENATGDFEVIVGFNGPSYQSFPNYPNLRTVKLPENIGIKTMINILAIMTKGKYIYKTDAHCLFDNGFNEILATDMQDNWIMTPRFYVLDPDKWQWQDERYYDYFYLCCPFTDPRGFRFKAGGHWPERTAERENNSRYTIDETPQIHGSGWMVERDFFLNKIGGFSSRDPLGHAQEPPYLGLKAWLGPWEGRVMVNKKTWYAHMHQHNAVKGYHFNHQQERTSYDVWARYWMGDKWGERIHNIDWFIEKFMPMPTWPENWRELLENWRRENKK